MGRVGGADMQRLRIVGGIDRDGGEAGVARGARDANGDLAAVGDQQLMEGHCDYPFNGLFMVGSSTMRRDSPSALNANDTTRMASPGAYICSGAISMYW